MELRLVEVWVRALVNNKPKYLLLHRSKDKFWQPVVGKVHIGETIIAGAIRELFEETGIKMSCVGEEIYSFTIKKDYISGKDISPQTEHCYVVDCEKVPEITFNNNPDVEHDSFKWVSYNDALKLLKWADNKTALTIAHEGL